MPPAALWPCVRGPQVVCVPLADVPGVKAGALIFLRVSHLLFDWVKLSNHQSSTSLLGVMTPPLRPSARQATRAHTAPSKPTRPYKLLSDVSHV